MKKGGPWCFPNEKSRPIFRRGGVNLASQPRGVREGAGLTTLRLQVSECPMQFCRSSVVGNTNAVSIRLPPHTLCLGGTVALDASVLCVLRTCAAPQIA